MVAGPNGRVLYLLPAGLGAAAFLSFLNGALHPGAILVPGASILWWASVLSPVTLLLIVLSLFALGAVWALLHPPEIPEPTSR